MKEAKILSEIKHDKIVYLLGVCEKPVSLMMELYESDFEPFNAEKKNQFIGSVFVLYE